MEKDKKTDILKMIYVASPFWVPVLYLLTPISWSEYTQPILFVWAITYIIFLFVTFSQDVEEK